MITICYLTNRDNPRLEWFLHSLQKQYDLSIPIEILVVDGSERYLNGEYPEYNNLITYSIIEPKPTPWQGRYRTASKNYFSAANARNTGIVYSKGDYIVYVDDLSVLMPTWWQAVKKAYTERYIVLGAYKKVKNLSVTNGVPTHYEETPHGNDSRLQYGSRKADGGWLYGCSCGFPIEWLLNVNGWDEITGAIGYEDCHLGLRLNKLKCPMYYDTNMLTLECEECHGEGAPFVREDYLLTEEQYMDARRRLNITGWYQKGAGTDVSHLLMDMAYSPQFWSWGNDYDLRKLRETKDFKLPTGEEKFWVDLKPIKEM